MQILDLRIPGMKPSNTDAVTKSSVGTKFVLHYYVIWNTINDSMKPSNTVPFTRNSRQ